MFFGTVHAGIAHELTAMSACRVKRMPLSRRSPLIASASPLGCDGVTLRVIGPSAEVVGQTFRSLLASAIAAAGGDPWARKW